VADYGAITAAVLTPFSSSAPKYAAKPFLTTGFPGGKQERARVSHARKDICECGGQTWADHVKCLTRRMRVKSSGAWGDMPVQALEE
jgi:hypothetical protein